MIIGFPLFLFAPVGSISPAVLNAQVSIEATSSVFLLINKYASEYDVSSTTIDLIVGCETGGTYDPSVQSFIITNGYREQSYGLAQIHIPDWPEITISQAKDPEFALNFLAQHLKNKEGNLWTCYRTLKASHKI